MKTPKTKRLSCRELSSFCAQTAMMLSGGLPLYEGILALQSANKMSPNADVYERLSRNLMSKGLLSEALGADDCWPPYLKEMVAVGEAAGRLEEVLNGLGNHYEREERIRRAIVHAVAYPLILTAMMLGIVGVMLLLVMPMFKSILEGMGMNVADAGSGFMKAGAALGWAVFALVSGILVFALVCLVLFNTGCKAKVIAFLSRLFPPYGKALHKLNASRITHVIGLMMKSGFRAEEAIQRARKTAMSDDIGCSVQTLPECGSLSESLEKSNLIDDVYLCMLKTGESVGSTETVLDKIARDYDEQAEESISALVSVIEPTLIFILSVAVGAMLLSVVLPMAGVLTGVL